MNENINVLDELSKGAFMGKDATSDLINKIDDKGLKKLTDSLCKDYKKMIKKIKRLYSKYSTSSIHKTNMIDKLITSSSINMKTMTDKSNSAIAQLILNGVNMGIDEGVKILNNKKIDKDVYQLVKEYVDFQEKYTVYYKKYL